MSKLTFDAEKHIYRLDDNIIPSVTQIMQPLNQRAYDGIDQAIMDNAAARGTAVHEAAEFYARYRAEECPEEYAGYFKAFKDWFSSYRVNVVKTEQAYYHPHLLYAGTIDLIAEVDGKLMIVDYKTTHTIKDMLTRVQLEAYARMISAQGQGVAGKAILQLRRDGSYTFKNYKNPDFEAWDVFASLLKIKAYTEKYGG